jgi:hypothetical protein
VVRGWIGGELVKEMIKELMEIYENSRLNDGEPGCIFAEMLGVKKITDVFNEGCMLSVILGKWEVLNCQSKISFLPFPKGVKFCSENSEVRLSNNFKKKQLQLYTPFKPRSRSPKDKEGETNARVDGIVGDFYFSLGTTSGIELDKAFKYLAVFEAKMYSGMSSKTKNVGEYDQVSRTIACIINSVIKTGISKDDNLIYYIVIYPKDNYKIDPAIYTKEFIETQIGERISGYKHGGAIKNEFNDFEMQWKDILKRVNIEFITWEAVLDEIDDNDISKLYALCKEFNRNR